MIFVIPRNIYLATGMSQKQVLDKYWLNLIFLPSYLHFYPFISNYAKKGFISYWGKMKQQ